MHGGIFVPLTSSIKHPNETAEEVGGQLGGQARLQESREVGEGGYQVVVRHRIGPDCHRFAVAGTERDRKGACYIIAPHGGFRQLGNGLEGVVEFCGGGGLSQGGDRTGLGQDTPVGAGIGLSGHVVEGSGPVADLVVEDQLVELLA